MRRGNRKRNALPPAPVRIPDPKQSKKAEIGFAFFPSFHSVFAGCKSERFGANWTYMLHYSASRLPPNLPMLPFFFAKILRASQRRGTTAASILAFCLIRVPEQRGAPMFEQEFPPRGRFGSAKKYKDTKLEQRRQREGFARARFFSPCTFFYSRVASNRPGRTGVLRRKNAHRHRTVVSKTL
jgi:hypothetical protein